MKFLPLSKSPEIASIHLDIFSSTYWYILKKYKPKYFMDSIQIIHFNFLQVYRYTVDLKESRSDFFRLAVQPEYKPYHFTHI